MISFVFVRVRVFRDYSVLSDEFVFVLILCKNELYVSKDCRYEIIIMMVGWTLFQKIFA